MFSYFDVKHFPLITVTLLEYIERKDFDDFCHKLTRVFEDCKQRQNKINIIFDASNIGGVGIEQAHWMAAYMKEKRDDFETCCIKTAVIVDSWWKRKMLDLLLWLQPPASDLLPCEDMTEALEWCDSVPVQTWSVPTISLQKQLTSQEYNQIVQQLRDSHFGSESMSKDMH